MLSRLLVALGLAAALVSGGALAILRTDFVANNLCAYAVASIEEATSATVRVARCSVNPAAGQLTIDGLEVGDRGGRIHLTVARVFVHVIVRPLLQKVRLEHLEVDHPDLELALEKGAEKPRSSGQCLPEVLDRFELGRVKIRKAKVVVYAPGGVRVEVPRVSATLRGSDELLGVRLSTRNGTIELPGRSAGLISTSVRAQLDLRGNGTLRVERADVIGTEASVFASGAISDLCEPQIEATGNVRVDDLTAATARLLPGLLAGVKGSLSADATVEVIKGNPRVKGDLRTKGVTLEGFTPGEVRARFDLTPARLKVEKLQIPFLQRGEISGSAELGIGLPGLPIALDLSLREMELAELLGKLGIARSHVVMRTGGKVSAKGTLLPLALAGEAALDLTDFAILDRRFEQRAKAQRILEFARGRLTTQLTVDQTRIALQGAALHIGSSLLNVDGSFYTDVKRGMDLLGHAEGFALEDFRGHLGPIPWSGKATVSTRVRGAYGDQIIEASTAVRDLHFLDLKLGDLSAQLTFAKMLLALDQIRGHKDRSSYAGQLKLDLDDPEVPIDAHLELTDSSLHDLIDLSVGLVPTLSSLADAEDVDGKVTGVIDVRGPVAGPDGTALLTFADVSLWGQGFAEGEAHFTLKGDEPRLQIDAMALRHGKAALLLSGRFGPRWELEMNSHTQDFTLADLDSAKAAAMAGPLWMTTTVRGVASHPLVDVDLRFVKGRAGKALLGEGLMSLRVDGKEMTWKGTVGTHALEGRGRLEGDFGYTSTLALRFPDLTGYFASFVPQAELGGGAASADVSLSGSLLKWRQSTAAVQLSALKFTRGDLTFENDGPGQLSFGPLGLDIKKLALRSLYTSATLQGTRGPDGKLDIHVGANIDGRLLQGLVPDLEHASGQYLLQASVTGPEASPSVLGNLRVEEGEVRLRGLPLFLRELNGSVSFSQDALVIDEMTGKLNNGDARLSGGLEMKNLKPQKIDMAVKMSEVNYKFQENLGATLDGDLTLFGPPLEPVLGGSVIVSRMRYAEDLDIERSLLDFSRKPPAPKVLSRSSVLVHFDLDVHLSRGVRIDNNLAKADLKGDLKVTGTSRSLGLLGSVNTVRGTAQFRGNEFQIEQGVLSFSDRQRIRPSFDFQALAQVQEYKVRMHAFGTPSEPHLSLVSEPALAEADLGFLLTFGFVSARMQQASFSAADSGFALIVEGLNKVSGFSEEVRRFIPKNSILRDPNIDFASDFSVATNRLEPMARFSSHVVSDKVNLKVLDGIYTKRYRGVLGYQISDSFSAQLQLDNEHITTGTDVGFDLKLRWEGE